MSLTENLQSNNNEIESLLKANSTQSERLRALAKKNKIFIYSVDDFINQPQNFLIQARRFAELNLLNSLTQNNTKDFELSIDNVKFFYENRLFSNPSNEYHLVTAIHLLFLLSSHRNEQFYAKIETLHNSDLQNSFIEYVLRLNDAIEEGNYRRVFQLKKQSPLRYFNPFLDRISQTVRFQIAKSAQKAYSQLSVIQALKVFQLQNEGQLQKFIDRYCEQIEEKLVNWVFRGGKIYFERVNTKKIVFNSDELILTALHYATELQKIA